MKKWNLRKNFHDLPFYNFRRFENAKRFTNLEKNEKKMKKDIETGKKRKGFPEFLDRSTKNDMRT